MKRVGISPLAGDVNLSTPIDIAVDNKYFNLLEYFEQEIGVKYKDLYRNPIRTGMYPDPSIIQWKIHIIW